MIPDTKCSFTFRVPDPVGKAWLQQAQNELRRAGSHTLRDEDKIPDELFPEEVILRWDWNIYFGEDTNWCLVTTDTVGYIHQIVKVIRAYLARFAPSGKIELTWCTGNAQDLDYAGGAGIIRANSFEYMTSKKWLQEMYMKSFRESEKV